MVQTYILRTDTDPINAVRQGTDDAICGLCPHRGLNGKKRTCYVVLMHGPRGVYDAYTRGMYPVISDDDWQLLDGRLIRFGTYGDPAAAPIEIWQKLASLAKRWTGYTHQWRDIPTTWAPLLMASVDSPLDWQQAKAKGYRTFRVRHETAALMDNEIMCPASAEMGQLTTCASCALCQGSTISAKDIVIIAHGKGSNNFQVAGPPAIDADDFLNILNVLSIL